MMTRDLTDTVTVITGASSGIGAATARAIAHAGGRVVLGARREERLRDLADELGERALAVRCDVRSGEDCHGLVHAALDTFGRLDALVANAGIGAYGGILDLSDEQLADIMETNLPGTVWPIRAALPAMLDSGGGDIIIVSSVAGLRGGADEAVYAATKFAQVGLAGALDRELREKGVRVTVLCPAGVNTEFAIGAGRTAGDPALDAYLHPEDIAHAVRVALEQPRRLRTTMWTIWPMSQGSP